MKKSLNKVLISILLILSIFGCASKNQPSKENIPLSMNSAIISGTLENGMNYFVQRNTNPENRIQLRLVVNAGSLMEEDDQLGVAHLVEHMAFNGSENFSKNEVIEFFESTGMAFGHDLNAYTSFEQTVYMLEIPADNPEFLEKAMLILKDWASGLTFVQEELDKERGVVTEEWRLSNENLNGRLSNAEYPALLGGSLFAERLPIGKMEIIQNIDRQRVVDFYEKWYRPDLMSVIVVGDISTEDVENAIINTMGEIPANTEPLKMPDNTFSKDEKSLLIFKDKEQPGLPSRKDDSLMPLCRGTAEPGRIQGSAGQSRVCIVPLC
jgi:zinc protease